MYPSKAAGKGVVLPISKHEAEDALKKIMLERIYGDAGNEVVIEEVGRFLSLLFPFRGYLLFSYIIQCIANPGTCLVLERR